MPHFIFKHMSVLVNVKRYYS